MVIDFVVKKLNISLVNNIEGAFNIDGENWSAKPSDKLFPMLTNSTNW